MAKNTNSSSFQVKDLMNPWCRAEVKTVVKNCSLILKPTVVWINSADTAWLILKTAIGNYFNWWAPRVTYFKHKILIYFSSKVCAIVHGQRKGSSELIFKPRGISAARHLLRLSAWSLCKFSSAIHGQNMSCANLKSCWRNWWKGSPFSYSQQAYVRRLWGITIAIYR